MRSLTLAVLVLLAFPSAAAAALRNGRGRTRFTTRLHPDRPRRVRWVAVYAGSLDRVRPSQVLVRVR